MKIPFLSTTKSHCCHQTKNGAPCNATPQAGKAYCFFHDPEVAEERAAARRQGGLTSIGKAAPVVPPNLLLVPLKTLADVAQLFEQTVNYVLQGQMDLRTAKTICSLANGQVRTLQANARAEREAAKATLAGKPEHAIGAHQPGVPHSRESACGNSHTTNSFSPPPKSNEVPNEFAATEIKVGTQNEALPDSTPRASFEVVKSFAEQRQQKHSAQNGFDPQHVETTPTPRPNQGPANARPDLAFIGIPGLLPRHLGYLKFAGCPSPAPNASG